MSRKKILILLLVSLEIAVFIPLAMAIFPREKTVRRISINAEKFKYSPSKIHVSKGDRIILNFSSLDVTHGFYLDGYPVELMANKGTTFRKMDTHESSAYNSGHDLGNLNKNWTRISSIKFTASKSGKFVFRCSKICGNLHPFMTGELVVTPNTPYHFAMALSIWITFSVWIYLFYKKEPSTPKFRRINLFKAFPWLEKRVKSRGFQFTLILPNFLVFYLFIISSLGGSPVGNRNITIVFVWILWWFLLKAIIVPLGGRIWCTMCPLPAPSEWLSRRRLTMVRFIPEPLKGLHHRFTGLARDWPSKLKNMWLQNIVFLLMISFGMILITRPAVTALMFVGILLMTFILSLIYRNRVFCRYLCPVGGFLGIYSMASMTELRTIDKDVCKRHKTKSCYVGSPEGWACPWNQYIGNMSRNTDCGLCTECIKSCPKNNIGFFIRPFGSDKSLRGYDELFNVIIMLVVSIVFSIVMLGPWGMIRDAANVTESGQIAHFFIFVGIIWGSALALFPALFLLISKLTNRILGKPVSDKKLALRLAYVLIPLGIFSWIAFSLPAIMINYGYIISVLSDPLGLGWDIFHTANLHFKPFLPEWIPVIQGIVLLSGLYFGLTRVYHAVIKIIPGSTRLNIALIPPFLFACIVINILLKVYMG